jgi:hypothetical protein
MKGQKYILGQKYIFALVGDGMVKCFEAIYATKKSNLYGYFDCGIEIRIDSNVDTEYIHFFNVTDSRLNDYINCSLYVFTSKEKMEAILPMVIKTNLTLMKHRADALMSEYMKLADDCTSIENALNSVKKRNFELTNPFEK